MGHTVLGAGGGPYHPIHSKPKLQPAEHAGSRGAAAERSAELCGLRLSRAETSAEDEESTAQPA